MQADISIVVAAYNRPQSMERLLLSLQKANYLSYQNISLIISIDYSGSDHCQKIARAFEWKFGSKEVVAHTQKMGLKNHILSCGDMSKRFDAVIVLEDDLMVSPEFYQYAQQAYNFYKQDNDVAGIALYNPVFNETAICPFEPVDDGFDNYFMQVPCSWGQMWTKEQWLKFRTYVHEDAAGMQQQYLPLTVQQWPDASSWKKLFYSYLIAHKLYFVYPRIGLSTNFGDSGQHLTEHQSVFQTPLLLGARQFKFSTLSSAFSIYDGYFEMEGSIYNKWCNHSIEVTFDLNGTKPIASVHTPYLISSKKTKAAIKKYAVSCYPFENNILFDIKPVEGEASFFSLAQTEFFVDEQQFIRLNEDVKRVFMNNEFIKHAAVFELKKQIEFQIGAAVLRPIRILKNFFKK